MFIMEDRVKSCLLIVFSIVMIALIAYNLYLGVTVQKIGIPGIFEISFGTKPERPAPPQDTPNTTSNMPVALHTDVTSMADSSKLYSFLDTHTGETVRLDIRFIPRENGGITDFNHDSWMLWVGEGRRQQTYDITMDKECPPCGPGIYDHLILRIENTAEYTISNDLVLNGVFYSSYVTDVGQGYTVAYLSPAR